MIVLLIGVSCVGTTTIGALLARRLDCPFFDLVAEIERHFGTRVKRLTGEEKRLHLREIRKDITFFRNSQLRADIHVDIAGLDAAASAERIAQLLEDHRRELADV